MTSISEEIYWILFCTFLFLPVPPIGAPLMNQYKARPWDTSIYWDSAKFSAANNIFFRDYISRVGNNVFLSLTAFITTDVFT
jgi:hypothetical protein